MTIDEAKEIVEAYEALLEHAMATLRMPGGCYVDKDSVTLHFDGNDPTLKWFTYESGDYGDGYMSENNTKIPVELFLMSPDELDEAIDDATLEDMDRREKLRRSNEHTVSGPLLYNG